MPLKRPVSAAASSSPPPPARATIPPAEQARRLLAARAAYEAERTAEACSLLADLIRAEPRLAPAHHLMGLCLINLGDFGGAETALRAALGIEKRDPDLHVVLAGLLMRPGQLGEAERLYRAALTFDRRHLAAALGLVKLLLLLGQPEEGLQVTAPLVAVAAPAGEALAAHADCLKHLGRMEEALALNQRAVHAGATAAQLEVSATLRELGRYTEAEEAARQAFNLVGRPPGAVVVHGRALQSLGRASEAEAAYHEALRQNPLHDGAHEHLGDLLWGRTGTAGGALDILDQVLAQRPTSQLVQVKSRILSRAGLWEEAYVLLKEAVAHWPDDASLHTALARAAVHDGADPARVALALAHSERADALAPDVPKVTAVLAETALAAGQPERSAELAGRLLRRWPQNQSLIALQSTAWRILGDARYRELNDYGRVVSSTVIDTPRGWPNLSAYLADLATALQKFHAVPVDSFGLTRKDGLETKQNLSTSDDTAVRAFFEAIKPPLDEHVARIGKGRDLLRRRNTGGHRIGAAWSVKTTPGGFHQNHLHSEGWLSSAFYVELPPAVEEDRQGWIKFGQPGIPTHPRLEPDHFVKPDPGRFVLFPSYMWHGTLPYTGSGVRLVMSVDVVPASRR